MFDTVSQYKNMFAIVIPLEKCTNAVFLRTLIYLDLLKLLNLSSFCQKYQQLVEFIIYLIISLHSNIGFPVVKFVQQIKDPSNKHY